MALQIAIEEAAIKVAKAIGEKADRGDASGAINDTVALGYLTTIYKQLKAAEKGDLSVTDVFQGDNE